MCYVVPDYCMFTRKVGKKIRLNSYETYTSESIGLIRIIEKFALKRDRYYTGYIASLESRRRYHLLMSGYKIRR